MKTSASSRLSAGRGRPTRNVAAGFRAGCATAEARIRPLASGPAHRRVRTRPGCRHGLPESSARAGSMPSETTFSAARLVRRPPVQRHARSPVRFCQTRIISLAKDVGMVSRPRTLPETEHTRRSPWSPGRRVPGLGFEHGTGRFPPGNRRSAMAATLATVSSRAHMSGRKNAAAFPSSNACLRVRHREHGFFGLRSVPHPGSGPSAVRERMPSPGTGRCSADVLHGVFLAQGCSSCVTIPVPVFREPVNMARGGRAAPRFSADLCGYCFGASVLPAPVLAPPPQPLPPGAGFVEFPSSVLPAPVLAPPPQPLPPAAGLEPPPQPLAETMVVPADAPGQQRCQAASGQDLFQIHPAWFPPP